MKSKGRNILILYGSQTGTAEDFSSNLAREAHKYEKMRVSYFDFLQSKTRFSSLSNLIKCKKIFLIILGNGHGSRRNRI